jgi:hypothetical protein
MPGSAAPLIPMTLGNMRAPGRAVAVGEPGHNRTGREIATRRVAISPVPG